MDFVFPYKQVLSVEFYSARHGYSGARLVFKGFEGNKVYLNYEWENDGEDPTIPTELLDLLTANGISLNEMSE